MADLGEGVKANNSIPGARSVRRCWTLAARGDARSPRSSPALVAALLSRRCGPRLELQ